MIGNEKKLKDMETQIEIKALNGHSDFVESVCFSPDGKTLASGSNQEESKTT